jgi:RimJ/RimL family protein N-acetyltransferase
VLWIAEVDGQPVGQIRLERVGEDEAEMHFAVAAAARGRGYGTDMLLLVYEQAAAALGVSSVFGLVKPENLASQRAFRSAQFTEQPGAGAEIRFDRQLA